LLKSNLLIEKATANAVAFFLCKPLSSFDLQLDIGKLLLLDEWLTA